MSKCSHGKIKTTVYLDPLTGARNIPYWECDFCGKTVITDWGLKIESPVPIPQPKETSIDERILKELKSLNQSTSEFMNTIVNGLTEVDRTLVALGRKFLND